MALLNSSLGAPAGKRRSLDLVEVSLSDVTYSSSSRVNTYTPSSQFFRRNTSQSAATILRDVTTTIAPYRVSAWMGPSGSGKTTLLSVAAGLEDRLDGGSIKVNGEDGCLPKNRLGIVWQEDLLLSNLTVRETINFSARLKSPKSFTDAEIDNLVDDIISKLGLIHVQHSLIGGGSSKVRGISGGERKRTAVAVELVSQPSVLLLDEPTSGLDSNSAFQLMLTLKELAKLGHAIAVIIHQPRTEIFHMVDHLLLLSKGQVLYDGDPHSVRKYLEERPSVGKLPAETNIADWIMDTIILDENSKDGSQLPLMWKDHVQNVRISVLESGTMRSSGGKASMTETPELMCRTLSTLKELEKEPKYARGFWTQLKLLYVRSARQQRGQRLTRVALILTFSWTLFTSLCWGYIPDTTSYTHSRSSLIFFLLIAQSNAVVTSSLVIFTSERHLLSRERAKKLYSVLPYFMAMTASDMVNSVILPTIYGVICYWTCNLRRSADSFFTFVLVFYLTVSAAQSTGLFLSAALKNTAISLMLAPLITICLFILGGFYIPFNILNPALNWASWLSMARYGFSALIINEYQGRIIECDATSKATSCPLPGSEVIASFGIVGAWESLWLNVAMLAVVQVALRLVTYLLLLRNK